MKKMIKNIYMPPTYYIFIVVLQNNNTYKIFLLTFKFTIA